MARKNFKIVIFKILYFSFSLFLTILCLSDCNGMRMVCTFRTMVGYGNATVAMSADGIGGGISRRGLIGYHRSNRHREMMHTVVVVVDMVTADMVMVDIVMVDMDMLGDDMDMTGKRRW